MPNFRAGLLAAALATTVIVPLAAVSARAQNAQEPAQEPAQDKAQDQAKDQSQVQRQDQVQAPAQTQDQASAQAQDRAQDQTQDQAQDQAQKPAQDRVAACPGNPDALGTSRVLPIDFSQYQQLGSMQYPDSLPLDDGEVVLTFDDGPLPPYSNQILDILAAQCVKATYFLVGEMARAFPAAVRRIYQEGHTIGTHSDHHPTGFGKMPVERMAGEIDGGIGDVSAAFGGYSRYLAPFFRIPGLERSDLLESELAERGLIIFSADVVADDWHHNITPNQIVSLALSRLEARGKGILLLHDIHPKTVAALPALLAQLKEHGFRIVQVVPSAAYEIAMARKPATVTLASAVPGELKIDDGIDGSGLRPTWPQAADDRAPDDAALPVPDVAAFDPDTGLTVDSSEAQWPRPPEVAAPAPSSQAAAPRVRKFAAHRARGKRDIAGSNEHERLQPDRRHFRPRAHARSGADGDHAGLVSKIKSVAALFSPAKSAH